MNNAIKYEYAKQNWELRDGIVYSKRTGKPVSFAGKDKQGHRFANIKVNGKQHTVCIYEAVFMLYHNRPIADDKELHHIDKNPENNEINNLIELTRRQHMRIHQFQCDDPMRAIRLHKNAWLFQWRENNGKRHNRSFHGINEAMAFRDQIERPRRQELRAMGLNCKKEYRGVTASELRKISRTQNSRLFRTHI
ncbi:HNH endonuclease [Escherichia coli]|uniref:HNH endonuclease n=1 Tax=Escherichia coli TaxID=562 RepID=UPI0004D634B6|nr:HNH endonuclease [Escherichia coli]KDT76725.1 HNH endonuclease family protein [Escherichia coli 3-373-03_S3_C3]KDU11176.1 HNH endonuclease family protein [Escherichia coli 3-373-03_S3_C2]